MTEKLSRPNLFKYATSELSQDAFLCWLLKWADHKFKDCDPSLHKIGFEFLSAIFKKHGEVPPQEVSVKIKKQYKNIDIFAIITARDNSNESYAVIIEDKVHSSEHSDQLARYREVGRSENFNDSQILCVYIKTGNQSDLSTVISSDYKYIGRETLIDILSPKHGNNPIDSIHSDFLHYLKSLDSEFRAYSQKPVDKWAWAQWEGFFSAIQAELQRRGESVTWDYVPNASGGFVGLWGNFVSLVDKRDESDKGISLYMQFEFEKFCFKASLGNNDKFWQERKFEFHDAIMEANKGLYPIVRPKPLRVGVTSTVAIWERFLPAPPWKELKQDIAEYYCLDESGLIDMEKVLVGIEAFKGVLNGAVHLLCEKNDYRIVENTPRDILLNDNYQP